MTGIELSMQALFGRFSLRADARIPGTGVTALFGRSGSGKTSFLRWVAGLAKGKQGRLVVNGELWEDSSTGVFVPPHRREVGFIFQDAGLLPHLNVEENLQFGLRRAPSRLAPDPLIDRMGIRDLLRRLPQDLSGGERQRVAIARSLLIQPKLLLLDEPLSSLDRIGKEEILPCLERLKEEARIPILYVSHALDEIRRFADSALLFENGAVRGPFPPSEIPESFEREKGLR